MEYQIKKAQITELVRLRFAQPHSVVFNVEFGDYLDLSEFEGRAYVPASLNFTRVKFVNNKTSRRLCVFVCNETGCHKLFRKWHNLFDHMRIHTGERPFLCPVDGCKFTFNQLSNQKKHLDTHKNTSLLKCKVCHQGYSKHNLIPHFENAHTMYNSTVSATIQ
ncbi:hypothetical protein FGO68_gene5694 [Halteria grandinella]|uniref:C2H2-type domain-containing protein n=1 Tax=Halteria grandinella TaxID=5974 RepID=A0A8J8T8F1_HALGN|nr:hypothetical protein FGO68_gene5694 [Halteria grandinella]